MTAHDWPYFVDNGVYSGSFDHDKWVDMLDLLREKMAHAPDFVVLPDVFNDAAETIAKHRRFVDDVIDRELRPAPVIQPGMPVAAQVAIADGLNAETIFVGGECRWQRAHGAEIVAEAHDRDLRVHIGNPGSVEGLVWAYQTGFDSVDTSSILQNQYFHWLEALEDAKHALSTGAGIKAGRQTELGTTTTTD